jgi:hypothetical protein
LTSKSGNVIAVFYGCKWPMILHKPRKPDEYNVRGMVYVEGIMSGEAFIQDTEDPRVIEGEQVFRLH